jgi:hypothetical protein
LFKFISWQDLFERCLRETDSDQDDSSGADESTYIDYDALISPDAVDDLWKIWSSMYKAAALNASTSSTAAPQGGSSGGDDDSIELDVNYDAMVDADDAK